MTENYKLMREQLFDARMTLALLSSKIDNPLYAEQLNKAKQNLIAIKNKMAEEKAREMKGRLK